MLATFFMYRNIGIHKATSMSKTSLAIVYISYTFFVLFFVVNDVDWDIL